MTMRLLILTLLLLPFTVLFSQLQANFSLSKSSGCSPLDVKFTNGTTGASANVVYTWDFGNGNTSALENPGTTYSDEKTFTVSLTATDGGIKSTISKTVTVYKKPLVNFTASQLVACVPATLRFNSSSTAGDGTITNYLWDFGDGKTTSGKDLVTVSNTYSVAQKPPLSLTVTNSFGCFASLSQPNLITLLRQLQASFTVSTTQLCETGLPIQFTNTSIGEGVLSYDWDFGDGEKSTELSPSHTYSKKGGFTVKLTVRNDAGCIAFAKNVVINVGNFRVNFVVPAPLCVNQPAYFSNTSTRPFDSVRWQINGVNAPADVFGNLSYRFTTGGNFTVVLTGFYKGCTPSVSKQVIIGTVPVLKGFTASNNGVCSVPITFTFTDSTTDAVKWQWKYLNNSTVFSGSKIATRSYADSGSDKIGLTVTNKFGCVASTAKVITFYQPKVAVIIKQSTSPKQSPNRGCPGLKVTFSTTPLNEIKTFSWDFGDGSPISTKAEPIKIYNTLGSYQVKLTYETKYGCRGTISYDSIYINQIAPFDFSVIPDTLICGNSLVTFKPGVALKNRDYIWLINGIQTAYMLTPEPFIYHFEEAGYYTISLIMRSGSCMDTVTKKNYIHVLPPFPRITNALNTCNGNRGLVTFTDSTTATNNWFWEFGDGTNLSYTSFVKTLAHDYKASGKYLAKLTVTNGTCKVSDTATVNVLLKQKPKLVSSLSAVCTSDTPLLTLSGYETNTAADSTGSYSVSQIQFGDLSNSKATINAGYWNTGFTAPVKGLETDKQNLRIITNSYYFNCQDTSNFAALKTSGPVADFTFNNIKCLNQQIVLKDASRASSNFPIVKWEWLMNDSTAIVSNNANPVSYKYKSPGDYFISLKVTDRSGCSYQTPADSNRMVTLSGPLAAFDVSDSNVLLNATVEFTNRSTFMDYSDLLWRFPNNILLTDENPSYLFDQEGNFNISLVTKNAVSGCADTARKTISVRRVQSIFTYDVSYSGQNNCPPLLANFTSTSVNAVKLLWTFGDGGTAENQTTVSHVYTAAGIFTVTLYSSDAFGRMDSSKQFIEVQGPYAKLTADTLNGCTILPVKLSADTINAISFRWDFGDGTIVNGTDTFAAHTYNVPGVYIPALILTDKNGCTATSESGSKITLDSLSVGISADPDRVVCDSSLIHFNSEASSLSRDQLGEPLKYLWTSSLHPGETFNTTSALWFFNRYGIHDVALRVTSSYGCNVEQLYKVNIKQGIQAAISGPGIICIYDSVSFRGNSIPAASDLTWQWNFDNGTSSGEQNPLPVKYAAAGIKPVMLVISNGPCNDTARYSIEVRDKPNVNLKTNKPFVCLGDTGVLTASGGVKITWQPTVYNMTNNGFTAQIIPASKTVYTATVTNDAGCVNTDSISIDLINPFKLTVEKQVFVCQGSGIQLSASGAASYVWTGSHGYHADIASPYLIPANNDQIKVIGYDGYNCFSDSALVAVTINATPSVELGPDKRVVAGQEFTLSPDASTDVIKWDWSPSQYLQCSNCATTLCKPFNDIDYKLTVTNNVGCIANDSMHIQMICGKDLVWIPSGFTPNNDNLNDRFVINGSGIYIKHLVIFDRWGKKVYECSGVNPGDTGGGWDGKNNGVLMPPDAYVYMVEVVCNNSHETFTYKGTVTLIR